MEAVEADRLVRIVKEGNRECYGLLVTAYQQQIFKYCFHMLGQLHEAEDVTQDVFVRGLERLEQYREGTSFKAWLYTMACHECLNKLKRAEHYKRLLRLFGRTVPAAQPEQMVAGLTYNAELRDALLKLGPKDRHIILQRIVEEDRFEDIAEQLDMSCPAVRKRYERAKKQLQQLMAKKGDGTDERSFSYR